MLRSTLKVSCPSGAKLNLELLKRLQIREFFAESNVDCARLMRCLHAFQQNAITQAPRVVAYRLPKFVRALRGFLSLAVTKVHIR
jgi:hypothetical protein